MMRNVLIVDDNADTRALYENCSTADVRLTTAPSGADCLQLVDESNFDAVLLDLSMHPLDGLAVAQEIRRNEQTHTNKKPVHLAFFTARIIDETVEEVAKETDVEMIFQKPCDPFELVSDVKKWLDSSKHFQMKEKSHEKGASQSNAMICLVAIVLLIISGCIFLWFNHRTEDWWALKWAAKKSQLDAMKIICDSNAEKKNALEIIIQQNNFNVAPELLTERPCVVETEEK